MKDRSGVLRFLKVVVASYALFASLAISAETIFDLSTYSQYYQGKTVKVKCLTISRFAGAFFCDDGTTGGEDAVEIDSDSVDEDSRRYLMTHCNDASAKCSGSVTGRFEASEYGDFYIRDATFKFNKAK